MFHKCYFKKIRPSVFEQKGVIIMPSILVSLSPQIYTPQLKNEYIYEIRNIIPSRLGQKCQRNAWICQYNMICEDH